MNKQKRTEIAYFSPFEFLLSSYTATIGTEVVA